ncbi:hypothetical protein EYF80_010012 [Liparis tanakae]|uniref:Uncharacterized protein n=1 Tax=Liparis tanakae TaxID=230148 RepID=A0A4Z2IQ24_9TELE|nr:hypothetical protein EYF80_010012 [Liparis tanakae]
MERSGFCFNPGMWKSLKKSHSRQPSTAPPVIYTEVPLSSADDDYDYTSGTSGASPFHYGAFFWGREGLTDKERHCTSVTTYKMRAGWWVLRVEQETFGDSTRAGQITKRPNEKDNDSVNRGEAWLGGNERCPLGQTVSNNSEHLRSLQALHPSPWGSSPGTGGPTQLPLPLESCLEQADYHTSPRRDMRPGILSSEAVEAAVDDSPCVWANVKPREQASLVRYLSHCVQEGGGLEKKQAERRGRKDRFIKQGYPINGKMAWGTGCADGCSEWIVINHSQSTCHRQAEIQLERREGGEE